MIYPTTCNIIDYQIKDIIKDAKNYSKKSIKKYHFFTDPGHGWLKVKTSDCAKAGILDQVTSCSFQRGDYLYLEEDCDAGLFLDAAGVSNDNLVFHRSSFKLSRIRSYPRYMENSRFK